MFKKKSPAHMLEELRAQLQAAEAELDGANAAHDRAYDRLYVEVPDAAMKAARGWTERGERDEVVRSGAAHIRGDGEQAKLEYQTAVEQVTRARVKRNDLNSRVSALDSSLNWEENSRRQAREAVAFMEASSRAKAVRNG